MPASAREQLQISALHQLRGFLRGEYGEAFRRPAFELIIAGHAESMERIGLNDVRLQFETNKKPNAHYEMAELKSFLDRRLDRVMRERISIIEDEWKFIVCSNFPLRSRSFDFCNFSEFLFPNKIDLRGSSFLFSDFTETTITDGNLSGAHFGGAYMKQANLQNSALIDAHLEGALLDGSNLDGIVARYAHFEGASLSNAKLRNADLKRSKLDSAELDSSELQGADFTGASIKDAMFDDAVFDDNTKLAVWDFKYLSSDIDSQRVKFQSLGAAWRQ